MNMSACFLRRHPTAKCFIVTVRKFSGVERASYCARSLCSLGLVQHASKKTIGQQYVLLSQRNSSIKFLNRFRSHSTLYTSFNSRETWNLVASRQILIGAVRNQSSSTPTSSQIPNLVDDLPAPPLPPSSLPPSPTVLPDLPLDSGLLEPTLASQGLAGWTPAGMLQSALEFLHVNFSMPWWLAIITGTLVARILLFPLVIKGQKNAINMNNNMPQMQLLQLKMTQARNSGNPMDAARCTEELVKFMKEKNLNPFKNMLVPFIQAPVFMSFFFGLRGMANLPVESLKNGGLWWFADLTIPDPFYLLPVITSTTLFLTIELGAEGGVRTDNLRSMRYVLRAIPIVIFPFIMNFPSAILCYWVAANSISLVQVLVLRLTPVREFFKIPEYVKVDPSQLPLKKPFIQGVKESMRNNQIARELEDRARTDAMRFRKAGTGPIQKTYTYDPTKQTAAPIEAKKKM